MKPRLRRLQLVIAVSIAAALAIPTQFATLWERDDYLSMAMAALNFPGIVCMFPFGGRFFPPEGFPGQSIARSLAMFAVQTLVWYFVFSWFRAAQLRRRSRMPSNAP